MTAKSIGVGVVGCGKIAQMMHLPTLQELPEFHIAALCDISKKVLDEVGSMYGVEKRHTKFQALIDDPAVDAVLICNFDHGKVVEACLKSGKHMLVEKPLAFTRSEGKALVEAARISKAVNLIGYMKFYDEGYVEGVEHIRKAGTPKSIQVHDFAGVFDPYDGLYTLSRGSDVSPELLSKEPTDAATRIEAELGPDHAAYRDLYQMLLMLGSHDLAALRGAFGTPEKVLYARAPNMSHIIAMLEFEGGATALLEVSFGAQYEWWDEWMEVHGDASIVRIDFNHPYVRNAPATVRVRTPMNGKGADTVITPLPEDAFRREWQHFARCIRNNETPVTPIDGGQADLELALSIIKALPPLTA